MLESFALDISRIRHAFYVFVETNILFHKSAYIYSLRPSILYRLYFLSKSYEKRLHQAGYEMMNQVSGGGGRGCIYRAYIYI